MDLAIFIKGFVLGFSIAAPVGPIGILCIRRTIAKGRMSGFVSGLGAATADGLYGSVAALGLTVISSFLVSQQFWLRLIGGLFLIYLGVRALIASPVHETAELKSPTGILGDYLSTFFLTFTNPMTILSFIAVFAGLGLAETGADYFTAGTLVAGVMIGSIAWSLSLTSVVGFFRQKFNTRAMVWVNRLSGLIIIGFGLWALSGLLNTSG